MAGRIDEAVGVIDGVNRDFSMPNSYVAGTLIAFLNGRQLKAELQNGWEELDPDLGTFRMKLPPVAALTGISSDPGDILFAYYNDGVSDTQGGAQLGGIPLMTGAELVRPLAAGALELKPYPVSAVDETLEVGVPLGSAEVVQPEMSAAENLRPTMISAEEE